MSMSTCQTELALCARFGGSCTGSLQKAKGKDKDWCCSWQRYPYTGSTSADCCFKERLIKDSADAMNGKDQVSARY